VILFFVFLYKKGLGSFIENFFHVILNLNESRLPLFSEYPGIILRTITVDLSAAGRMCSS
jgi:hypothetical protein